MENSERNMPLQYSYVFLILLVFYLNNAFCYVEKPGRKLQQVREQISTIPDDYLELTNFQTSLGIESEELRKILYSLNSGSLKNFPTLNEVSIIMENLMELFGSAFIRKFVIGTSFEGRPIEAYKIGFLEKEKYSKQSSSDELSTGKPSFLLTSMHHSREPASLTTGIYFVSKLLEDSIYKQDPSSYFLMSSIDIWYVPLVNPDGYAAIERTRNFGIRKNQRKTCNSGRSDEDGVDINRNYDFHFDYNQNSRCDPQEYSGEFPFSEPETRAIRDLILKVGTFKAAVNLHTFGDLWTIPWNCCKDKIMDEKVGSIYNELKYEILISSPSCIIRTLFHTMSPFFIRSSQKGFTPSFFENSKEFTNASKYCFSSAVVNPKMNYEATGEADDYLLGVHGIISLSPEIGPEYYGFYPPKNEIFPIANKYYPQIMAVAFKTSTELSITAHLELNKKKKDNFGILEFTVFNSGLSSLCPERNKENSKQLANNDVCFSIFSWELISSDCPEGSEFEPGRFLIGNYSAGFRYRSTNAKGLDPIFKRDECNSHPILLAVNHPQKKKNLEEGAYKYIKGFKFDDPLSSRAKQVFGIHFNYIAPSAFTQLRTNKYYKVHTCVANIYKQDIGLCHCGYINFSNEETTSNTALLVQSTNSDHLCNHLFINRNEFLPYSDSYDKKDALKTEKITILTSKPTNFGIDLIYISICLIAITTISIISIIYTFLYRRYNNDFKAPISPTLPVEKKPTSKP
ncbi:zinc carboxypeptidase superfamily protein [Cryptosporidium felis]|nr:zinc carboxypeptidase superfamily protein [Cryptosporidium felis]